MSDNHIYLIDGHALIYRAYYALLRTPLSNAQGTPTGAVYGFANYLLSLLDQFKCGYCAVVFDSPVPTFREEMYAQYKANREEMPADLKVQIPLIKKLVEVMNIFAVQQERFEADDIIAHITEVAVHNGYSVSIVTKDKDLMQLLAHDGVRMVSPETGGGFSIVMADQVKDKMGVPPERILDLLSLMGDSSDNIPGVPGIGPKTAIKMLEKSGTLAALLANPAILQNPKLQEKITSHRAEIELSRTLATLNPDIGFAVSLESLRVKAVKRDECIAFFKEMNFVSFLKHPLFDKREELAGNTAIAQSIDDLREFLTSVKNSGILSIDTETTSLVPRQAKLVGVSMAFSPASALYVPIGHDDVSGNLSIDEVLAALKPVLEDPAIKKIGQNLKYDYQIFKSYHINLQGISFDTMVAAYVLDPSRRQLGLGDLATQWLGLKTIPIEDVLGKGKQQISFAAVPVILAARYSGEDAVLPLMLKEKMEPLLVERNLLKLFEEIEIPLIRVLAEMEWKGMVIDTGFLRSLSTVYTASLQLLTAEIQALAGVEFNLNSPKQLSDILFDKLGLSHSKKTKTGLSTDVDALERIVHAHPIVPKILRYREDQKLLSTYIDALPLQVLEQSGRVHSSFNQTVTATGRLSSTNPNVQNIPIRTDAGKKIRQAFIAPPDHSIVSADYSQIELRILAHCSNDLTLVTAFLQDADIHVSTASAIYGVFPEMVSDEMRRNAKTINFGLMYGMGPVNLAKRLSISFKAAQEFIDLYFAQFPSIRSYMDSSIERARGCGYSETLLGRRRYLPDINAQNRQVREAAERTAVNTPVQGTAADIIKIAMINIARSIDAEYPGAHMLLQVHDELVFEVSKERAASFKDWVVAKMSTAYKLSVPLKVEAALGATWSDAH